MSVLRFTRLLALAAMASAALTGAAIAAPVWLQDYEAPGNLDPPFNLAPDFSGTTVGVVATTDTTTHVPTDDAISGSGGSAQLFLEHATGESPTAAGWQWQVRLIPNNGANNTGAGTGINPLFAADGYVGYYLKVDSSVTADIQTSPVLEGPGGTGEATSAVLQTVIKDGQWHRYQWNMDDPSQWPGTFTTVYSGGLGNTTLEATNSFDSIALVSSNGGNATILIDQIGYDSAGELPPAIPEPSTLALAGLGVLACLGVRRRVA